MQQLRVRTPSSRDLEDSHIIDIDPSFPPIVHSSQRRRTVYGDEEANYESLELMAAARSRSRPVRTPPSRDLEDSHVIDIDPSAPPIAHSSPRRRTVYGDEETNYESLELMAAARSRSRPVKRWIHFIPVTVILCILILWWISRPVKVVMKDGWIEEVLHTEIPREFENDFWTNHTLLEVEDATSPMASKSSGFADNIDNEASTDSTRALQNPNESKPTGNGSLAPDIEFSEYPEELLYD